MKMYELELRLKNHLAAKSEKEAKREMAKHIRAVLRDEIIWRIQLITVSEV